MRSLISSWRHSSEMQAPGVNTMAAASAASGPPAGGPDRPDRSTTTVSMAGPVMDGPNLIVGQNRPRDRGGNDHVRSLTAVVGYQNAWG